MKNIMLILALTMCVLAGCANRPIASSSKANWAEALHNELQAHLKYPDGMPPTTPPYATVKIQLTYSNGKLGEFAISKSSGDAMLDSVIIDQLRAAPIANLVNDAPRKPLRLEFSFDIMNQQLQENFKALEKTIFTAIQSHTIYPRTAIRAGLVGAPSVNFKFHNGDISDAKLETSSHYRELDQAAIETVSNIPTIPTPVWARDKNLDFSVKICYILYESNGIKGDCEGKITLMPVATRTCSEIGFQYLDDKIQNAHVLLSSGSQVFDNAAAASVATGHFTPPPGNTENSQTNFRITVCYQTK